MAKIFLIVLSFLLLSCDRDIAYLLFQENQSLREEIQELKKDLQIEKDKILILSCESGFRHGVIPGDNGKSFGIAQFQKKTWEYLTKLFNMPGLDIKSKDDQLKLLDKALREGYGKYWSCHPEVVKKTAKKLRQKRAQHLNKQVSTIFAPDTLYDGIGGGL